MFNFILRSVYRLIRSNLLHNIIPKSNSKFNFETLDCVEVIGFFESYSGIGESARLCAESLHRDGYRVKCTSVESMFRKKAHFKWSKLLSDQSEPKVRIFHLNPPMLPLVIFHIGILNFLKTYNIGYWAWELEDLPNEWKKAIRYMNAFFTPSDFSGAAIKKYTNKPVSTVMHPVSIASDTTTLAMRKKLHIPNEVFLVSSVFSFGSGLERKNPQALVKAFNLAFNNRDDAFLVLKSNSGTTAEIRELTQLFTNHKIILIDDNWSREEIVSLIRESNLYASLHRSEGFGLTIAEAMLLDVPVMVTNWSGNTGFCSETNAYLIDYELIPVNSSHSEFSALSDLRWAEPSISQAGSVMRELYQAFTKSPKVRKSNSSQNVRMILESYSYKKALQKLG